MKRFHLFRGNKGKISRLTAEELHFLIELRESGQIEKLMAHIENWSEKKQFDIDSAVTILNIQATALILKGLNEEELLTRVNKIYEQHKDLTNIQGVIALNFVYTMVNFMLKGELPENAKNLDEILQLLIDNKDIIDSIYRDWQIQMIQDLIGWRELGLGHFDSALKFITEAYLIAKKYNWKSSLITHSNVFAVYYHQIGEFNLAIEKYKEILETYKHDMSSISVYLVCSANLCESYIDLGKYEEALKIAKEIVEQAKTSKNLIILTTILSRIIDICLELNLTKDLYFYLGELDKLTKIPEAAVTATYHFKVARAAILRKSEKFADQIEAQTLYIDLIENTPGMTVNFDHDFALLDLILKEIKITGNEERYVELEKRVQKLKEKGEQQRSYIWIVEIALLESKIAVINKDLKKAQILLDQSLKLAREKKLRPLLYKVSKEYDHFLDEKQKWENDFTKPTTIRERIESVRVDETIDHALHKNVIVKEIPEEPLYLLLLANTGVTIYAHTFKTNQPIDEILVGGFLSAINTFCQEMFASKGFLERVKYQDFTILLEPIGESLMCCYVIHGESFMATQRLKKFAENIEKGPLYTEFLKVQQTGDIAFNHQNVNDLVASFFIS